MYIYIYICVFIFDMYVLVWLYRALKFNRKIVHPMFVSSPVSAVALLFCGGFYGIGLTGWYRLTAVRSDTTVEPATSCGECQCECTSTSGPSARLDVSFFSLKADGFVLGLLTGLVISCLEESRTKTVPLLYPVNKHGDARATATSPRRIRRGGGKLEVASARASDFGLVR